MHVLYWFLFVSIHLRIKMSLVSLSYDSLKVLYAQVDGDGTFKFPEQRFSFV
jgi:hypothetical protein